MILQATLHILCGKIASGKSTLAAQLAKPPGTVILSEDNLLASLYEGDMQDISDYVRNSARLRAGVLDHIAGLLQAGLNVVLDFAANTPDQRAWMAEIVKAADCAHVMHYLDVPDEICRARLHARNASGAHPFQVSDDQFDWITEHFVPPHEKEYFNLQVYTAEI